MNRRKTARFSNPKKVLLLTSHKAIAFARAPGTIPPMFKLTAGFAWDSPMLLDSWTPLKMLNGGCHLPNLHWIGVLWFDVCFRGVQRVPIFFGKKKLDFVSPWLLQRYVALYFLCWGVCILRKCSPKKRYPEIAFESRGALHGCFVRTVTISPSLCDLDTGCSICKKNM